MQARSMTAVRRQRDKVVPPSCRITALKSSIPTAHHRARRPLAALYRSPIQKRRDGGQRYSVSGQYPIALSDDHRITWARDAGNAITPTS